MRRAVTIGLLLLMILSASLLSSPAISLRAQTKPTPPPVPKLQPLSRDLVSIAKVYMNSDGHDYGIAIGVIAVEKDGAPQYSAGFYGTIAADSKQAPTPTTLFEIGSTSKVYTAVLLAIFVNEGRVKLDDPIQKYLPKNVTAPTYQGKGITLRDLATHRSGLPDMPDNKLNDELKPYTIEDMYNWLNSYKLTRAPGSDWEYSNIGFGLLGTILSGIAKRPYDALINLYMGTPLNMPDTVLFPSDAQMKRLATGYTAKGDPALRFFEREGGKAVRETDGVAGGGQLYSTLNDMLQFAAASLGLFNDGEMAQAFALTQQIAADGQGKQNKMGLGWQLTAPDDSTGVRRIWKNGATDGFQSYITLYENGKTKYAVVALGNGRSKQMFDPMAVDMLKALVKAQP